MSEPIDDPQEEQIKDWSTCYTPVTDKLGVFGMAGDVEIHGIPYCFPWELFNKKWHELMKYRKRASEISK